MPRRPITRHWSEEDSRLLAEMLAKDMPVAKMARRLRKTPRTIKSYLAKLEVRPRTEPQLSDVFIDKPDG